jgi:acyl-CoA reductase-like NAD-dependent aldehyde dehydrogenase
MNRCDYLDPGLAWTGFKDSGKGASLSRWGFAAVTRRKSWHFRLRTT